MATLSQVTDECLLSLQGFGLSQSKASHLTADVTSGALTWTLTNVARFSEGMAEIESELVYIASVDRAANSITIAPDGRGFRGTTAAAHTTGKRLTMNPTFPRTLVKTAINDAIIGTWPDLWGIATTTFTFNSPVFTYELPAAAERVMRVSTEDIGPSGDWIQMSDWSVNDNANTTVYVSGKTLTLHDALWPTRTVHVVYTKRPTVLTDAAEFTTSGLAETAKPAVIFLATARMVAYMDAARLPVNSVEGDDLDQERRLGSAATLSRFLSQQAALEIARERARLQSSTPPVIHRVRRR